MRASEFLSTVFGVLAPQFSPHEDWRDSRAYHMNISIVCRFKIRVLILPKIKALLVLLVRQYGRISLHFGLRFRALLTQPQSNLGVRKAMRSSIQHLIFILQAKIKHMHQYFD